MRGCRHHLLPKQLRKHFHLRKGYRHGGWRMDRCVRAFSAPRPLASKCRARYGGNHSDPSKNLHWRQTRQCSSRDRTEAERSCRRGQQSALRHPCHRSRAVGASGRFPLANDRARLGPPVGGEVTAIHGASGLRMRSSISFHGTPQCAPVSYAVSAKMNSQCFSPSKAFHRAYAVLSWTEPGIL